MTLTNNTKGPQKTATPTMKAPNPPMRASSRLAVNEIIEANSEVKDSVSAQSYLTCMAMAISGKPFSTDNLSDILFHITQLPGVNLPAQNAIRAVAFLLEDAAIIENADKIAKLVLTAISPHIAKIHDASVNIKDTATQIKETQNKISDLSTNLNGNNADTLIGSIDIGNRLEKVQEAVTSLTSQVKEASQQSGYKKALLTGLDKAINDNTNSQDTQRAARNVIKACQILINIPADSQLAPGKISHAQLVEKIKEAIKTITKEDSPEMTIRAVSQFRNGGMVIEMTTPQAANHLRNQTTKDEFINALEAKATLKERLFLVIIQFVPLTFDPSKPEQIQELETENGWAPESITMARWIKPPAKQATTQRVAHLLITLKDSKITNEGIRDGITLNKNRLQMKKNKREPVRCAKCQHYGHIARDCLSHRDTCANCAEDHRTNECTNKNRTCCISCESDDHASWNRNCPEFERRCIDLDTRDHDNTMPYFPSDENWTLVQAPPRPKPYERPQDHHQQDPPHHTQGTLKRHFIPRGTNTTRGARPSHGCYLPSNSRLSPRIPSQNTNYQNRPCSRSQTPAASTSRLPYV